MNSTPIALRNDILKQSRLLSRAELQQFLKTKYGVTAKEFDSTVRKYLPKESKYQREIMEWLQERYPTAFFWKAAAGEYSRGGLPDICVIIGGRFYGFEVKRPIVGRVSPLQRKTIEDIRRAGGRAAVVSFPTDCEAVINGQT